MTKQQEVTKFIESGQDPVFVATPNHPFIARPQFGEDRVVLVPGHFYTFQELNPVQPYEVPTVDEVELMKYPGKKEDELITKYTKVKKPYYDNRPIILYLGNDIGLDVKLMSQVLRKVFVRTYMTRLLEQVMESFNDDGEPRPFMERVKLPKFKSFLSVDYRLVRQLVRLPEVKLDLLVNKYKRDTMTYLTLIDWPEVCKLHLANYSTDRTVSMRSSFSLIEVK